jgi:hypothetical protein
MSLHYRKKPVVIEAWRFMGQYFDAPEWILPVFFHEEIVPPHPGDPYKQRRRGSPVLVIPTPEGTMRANIGDWIIKGVKSEIYPCKPDIFDATYEEAYVAGDSDNGQVFDGNRWHQLMPRRERQ